MTDNVTAEELIAFIERVETLTEEKQVIQDHIKDVYAEARGRGYDASIMREIIRLRKMKPDERAEHEAVLQVYLDALGMA
jgi:uncharacterized protein (UPF0335 family)